MNWGVGRAAIHRDLISDLSENNVITQKKSQQRQWTQVTIRKETAPALVAQCVIESYGNLIFLSEMPIMST